MRRTICISGLLMLVCLFTLTDARAQEPKDRSGEIQITDQPSNARIPAPEGKKVELPLQPMYMYKDGKRVELEQDFNFLAIRFSKATITKAERHEYYKSIHLVLSELKEADLLEKKINVIRLMPGATERKWNIFTEHLRQGMKMSFVGRVFQEIGKEGLNDLLVATDEIEVRFFSQMDDKSSDQLTSRYPLRLVSESPMERTAIYAVTEKQIDTTDLANRIFESGSFDSVSPVLIHLKGRPLSDAQKLQAAEIMKRAASKKPGKPSGPAQKSPPMKKADEKPPMQKK